MVVRQKQRPLQKLSSEAVSGDVEGGRYEEGYSNGPSSYGRRRTNSKLMLRVCE